MGQQPWVPQLDSTGTNSAHGGALLPGGDGMAHDSLAQRRELGGGLPASCGPRGAVGSGHPWGTCLGWVRVHPTPLTAVDPQRQK